MTWVTIVLTSLFLLLGIVGAMHFRPKEARAGMPTFVPGQEEPISEDARVTINAVDDEDTIFYTIDGSTPSRKNGIQYKGHEVTVSPGTVLKAVAFPQRGDPSEVAQARYRAPKPRRPSLRPWPDPLKPITGKTRVTIEKGAESDKVYYTTDGSEPTASNRLYTVPITVSPGTMLKVRAFAPHAPPSEIVEALYGVKAPSPTTLPKIVPPTTAPATAPTTAPATAPTTAPATRPAGGGND